MASTKCDKHTWKLKDMRLLTAIREHLNLPRTHSKVRWVISLPRRHSQQHCGLKRWAAKANLKILKLSFNLSKLKSKI